MSAFPISLFDQQAVATTKLTVLSMGLGQESTALLLKYIYDQDFKKRYVGDGDFIVIFSDTGNEFPQTYAHGEKVKELCKKHRIPFYWLTPDMGFHGPTWPSLQGQFERNRRVFSKIFPKSCTDNLKIKPFHRALDAHIGKTYQLPHGHGMRGHTSFAKYYGKINVWIGFAKGEESRMRTEPFTEKYKQVAINHIYPLIDLGMGRKECQEYIKECGMEVPIPSNCMMCPFLLEQEIVYLHRFHPETLEQWAKYEADKIEKDRLKGHPDEKNLGVWGRWIKDENRAFLLKDALRVALEKYGEWSDEQLIEYRWSHGHCVSSKY